MSRFNQLSLRGRLFHSVDDVRQNLLADFPAGSYLPPSEGKVVRAIARFHPGAETKLAAVDEWKVDFWDREKSEQVCLHVVREDGTEDNFSMRKTLDNLSAVLQTHGTARTG